MRIYGEAGWCFHFDGGAEPWEFQFGTELSKPGPTGLQGTPLLRSTRHFRRGGRFRRRHQRPRPVGSGGTNRARSCGPGLHYFNGKSSQFQTFDKSEQQIGFGLWYDF